MKIGITCYPTYGGSGVVATELGIELAARGHQVHFITYSQPFRLTGREEGIFYHEVPVSNYPLFEYPPYDLALATRMSEVAEYYELDLLHVHYAIPHSVCALLARQMLAKRKHLPFVTTLHGTDITLVGLDRSYLPITRFAIEESDGVTSISNYLREKTVHDFGILRPIEVIPNFVNCDEYKPLGDTARRRPGALCRAGGKNPAPPFELPPGQAHPRCGRGLLPGRARNAGPLLMVGDGPDRSSAEWLVNNKGLQNRVHFLGKQERVHELLPVADLMIMPSELESFGLAALEAMACKVPTIATRVGGVSELIEDGVTGRLFAVGDVDAMAVGAIELLADDDRLAAMGEAGRQAAQDRYCASRIIPVYEQYYETVLARAEV